jgi:hypothetical protein
VICLSSDALFAETGVAASALTSVEVTAAGTEVLGTAAVDGEDVSTEEATGGFDADENDTIGLIVMLSEDTA